jgi:hypothetical protein
MNRNEDLKTERFVRLLLAHPKGEKAIDYFVEYEHDVYKVYEGKNGLDTPFPWKILFLTQKWNRSKKGNNDRITGLTKKETGEIYQLFEKIAMGYGNVLRINSG